MSKGAELLAHIREAFADEDKLATAELLSRLCDRPESPWADIRGKQLNDRGLAVRLKPYGIKSKDVRLEDGHVLKGYRVEEFHDAWKRYVPPSYLSATSATSATKLINKNKSVADVADVADHTRMADFYERAAILEFDAALTREDAERRASIDLKIPEFLLRK